MHVGDGPHPGSQLGGHSENPTKLNIPRNLQYIITLGAYLPPQDASSSQRHMRRLLLKNPCSVGIVAGVLAGSDVDREKGELEAFRRCEGFVWGSGSWKLHSHVATQRQRKNNLQTSTLYLAPANNKPNLNYTAMMCISENLY